MRLLQAALPILLIPALVCAQDQTELSGAAKALLKRTHFGLAEITRQDGTQEHANIVRVTDRFVAIRHRPVPTCQSVELSTIRNIKWEHVPDDLGFDSPLFLILTLPIWPYIKVKTAIRSHDSKLGSWESQAQPNQPSVRLRFTYSWDHQGQGQIVEQEVTVRTGRYRFEEGRLYKLYDDALTETSYAVRFECDQLLIDAQALHWAQGDDGPAYAPIIGRWSEGHGNKGHDSWNFRPDGTFREIQPQALATGSYRGAKGSVDITWNQSIRGAERWQIRTANGSLFITRDSKTIEFKRCPPFY
jgi:hypothetical protein